MVDHIRISIVGAFLSLIFAQIVATAPTFAVVLLYILLFVLVCYALRCWWKLVESKRER